jgi:hypothetical protein
MLCIGLSKRHGYGMLGLKLSCTDFLLVQIYVDDIMGM